MKTYRVRRATTENFIEMMRGNYIYDVECLDIEAETPEEAVDKARADGYEIINEGYVKTVEELEAKAKAWREERAAEEAKKEAAKAKRKETEERKAAEAGMTVKEYRAEKWRQGEIRRLQRILKETEEALKKLGA